MLRNIALSATALAFCLFMFFWLLNRPEYPMEPGTVSMPAVASAPARVTLPTPAPVVEVQATPTPAPTAAPATVAPEPSPVTVETQIAQILEENNRGIETPVRVSRMLDTITVRWALNDRADVVADADAQIGQALTVIGDEYRLINFEGTFGLVYPDGRRAEDVVLWVTYEDGREVSRKVAPVLVGE